MSLIKLSFGTRTQYASSHTDEMKMTAGPYEMNQDQVMLVVDLVGKLDDQKDNRDVAIGKADPTDFTRLVKNVVIGMIQKLDIPIDHTVVACTELPIMVLFDREGSLTGKLTNVTISAREVRA